ncbi:hypothetical protein RSOLAG1IB_10113 [Rhizoctonia solani AG-1 IB]|uniref:Uncharacterized protein n=1 Tax=Thanatephorus cucumeris (strain AG1-IB / isolate 7/3/14) TaxID=1108050 RepID=A0A0B7FV17_THACB|nr:hypothetical protein RSOLAG1IB_10113 [Rhizoctonia solani AG-1 IB]
MMFSYILLFEIRQYQYQLCAREHRHLEPLRSYPLFHLPNKNSSRGLQPSVLSTTSIGTTEPLVSGFC